MSRQSTPAGMSARKARVTITELAQSLNMTKGTVSRALNGYSDISEATRARVKTEADRMGYVPLALAQAIRTGRAKSLGLVLQGDETGGLAPFLSEFLAGVSSAVSQHGWTLTVATGDRREGVLDIQARLVAERKADGFILPRSRVSDDRVRHLAEAGVPFVLFGREPDGVTCDWFDVAGEDAMADAVVRLAEMGHQRIGFLRGHGDYVYARLRFEGYRAGLARAGLAFDPELVGPDAITVEAGAASAAAVLSQAQPPTAIVCAVDLAALGLYQVATAAGLTIGRDLSVISYDGIPEGEFATPGLTTYSVDRRHAGERLASILIDRIRQETAPPVHDLVPARLLVRASDGPPVLSSDALAQRWRAHSKQSDRLQREETK